MKIKQKLRNCLVLHISLSLLLGTFLITCYHGCTKVLNETLFSQDFLCLKYKENLLIIALLCIILSGLLVSMHLSFEKLIQYYMVLVGLIGFITISLIFEARQSNHNLVVAYFFFENIGLIADQNNISANDFWNMFDTLILTEKALDFHYCVFYTMPMKINYWGGKLLVFLVLSVLVNYASVYVSRFFKKKLGDWPLFDRVNIFLTGFTRFFYSKWITLLFCSMLTVDIISLLPQFTVLKNFTFIDREIDILFFLFFFLKIYIIKERIGEDLKFYFYVIGLLTISIILEFIITRCWVLLTHYLIFNGTGSFDSSLGELTMLDTGPMGLVSLLVYFLMKILTIQ